MTLYRTKNAKRWTYALKLTQAQVDDRAFMSAFIDVLREAWQTSAEAEGFITLDREALEVELIEKVKVDGRYVFNTVTDPDSGVTHEDPFVFTMRVTGDVVKAAS